MNPVRSLLILLFSIPLTCFAQPPPDISTTENSPILGEGRLSEYLDKQEQSILQRHRPFYFAYGDPLSKLQLSFKSPLFRNVPLFFAYTQSMFWSLLEDSKPFEDLTFNPELFYRWKRARTGFESVDIGIFSHQSNGKAGLDSRSLNLSYLRFNFALEGRRWLTRAGVEFNGIFSTEENNRDIHDYIGPLSLHLEFVQLFDSYWFDKSEIGLDAVPGGKYSTDWNRGGYQVTWSFRLGQLQVVPAFYIQYYTGYGETMLYYNKTTHALRAGVIF